VFVTIMLAAIDLKTRRVTVTNAAHCPIVLRRAAQGDTVQIATEGNFPLGVMPGVQFEQETCDLQPGDVACLFTDGVTEAMNADKDLYGYERLLDAVGRAPSSAETVLRGILDDVHGFVGDTKQSDDLTCVCVGVKAQAPPAAVI